MRGKTSTLSEDLRRALAFTRSKAALLPYQIGNGSRRCPSTRAKSMSPEPKLNCTPRCLLTTAANCHIDSLPRLWYLKSHPILLQRNHFRQLTLVLCGYGVRLSLQCQLGVCRNRRCPRLCAQLSGLGHHRIITFCQQAFQYCPNRVRTALSIGC